MSRPSTRRFGVGVAALALLVLGACGTGGVYDATPVPTPTTTAVTGSTATSTPSTCNPLSSYAPVAALTGVPLQNAQKLLVNPGRLTVGVSADSLLLGSRNPLTGQLEGFDIDMAKAVAKALFGDENKIQLVVISSADRIPALTPDAKNASRVDMVARAFSMTCARWGQVAFSAEYYQAGLKLLVPDDATGRKVTGFAQLAGKRVCAPTGTSTIDFIQKQSGVVAVGAATHTGCLVLFQQGTVDAIAGDDTVLAGLAAQDPYAYVPQIKPLTSEPYGLGMRKDNVALAAFTNKVLADMVADGRWKAIYDKWFAGPLGPGTAPAAVYGRTS